MATKKQMAANQLNAQKSTGPTSAEGKCKVSGNRITHGVLSNKLLVNGERAEEYTALLDDLFAQLAPVGAVERSLVEKIGVSLWRQRRLIAAEAATIELATNPRRIASSVEVGMGLSGFGSETVGPEDLLPPDQEQLDQQDWCRSILAEHEALKSLDPNHLARNAPGIFAQLESDALEEGLEVSQYLAQNHLSDYLRELVTWCREEAADFEKRRSRFPAVVEACASVKDELLVPWGKLDLLSKYQTALDNQLYKSIRALRESQEWRLGSNIGFTVSGNTSDAA